MVQRWSDNVDERCTIHDSYLRKAALMFDP